MSNEPGTGALLATTITAQTLGGSLAVVYLALHPITTANGIDAAAFEAALTVIFSTICSIIGMIGHLVARKIFPPAKDTPP